MAWEHIFTAEKMKQIQTEELSAVKNLSINELAERIESIHNATREMAARLVAANAEMHVRLQSKGNDELEAIIEKVPAASAMLAMRGHNHKPKKETFEQKVNRKADNMARKNPLMQQFLDELKAKGK